MIQPCDNQAYRCPKCDRPIAASGDGAERRENPESSEAGSPRNAYARLINETLACFRFSEAEAEEFSPQVIGEIERRLPAFLKTATVAGLLGLILRRSRMYFLSQGVPLSDVEELEGKLAVKVLDQLNKGNLPGNASAWSKTIQGSIFADYLRARYRERNWLGVRQDAASLAEVQEPMDDEKAESDDEKAESDDEKAESVRVFIEGLPPQERDIVERLQAGEKWADIAAHYQKTVVEVKKAVRSLEWPEGSLPLRRRRRRRAA